MLLEVKKRGIYSKKWIEEEISKEIDKEEGDSKLKEEELLIILIQILDPDFYHLILILILIQIILFMIEKVMKIMK